MSWVSPGQAPEMFAISSSTSDSGGSSRFPGDFAASSRARSVMASIIAIRNGPADEPPVLVPTM